MTKIRLSKTRYTATERKAEEEIDNFLRKINGATQLDIIQELKQLDRR